MLKTIPKDGRLPWSKLAAIVRVGERFSISGRMSRQKDREAAREVELDIEPGAEQPCAAPAHHHRRLEAPHMDFINPIEYTFET